MIGGMQASLLIFILLFAYSHTIKPPGYVEPEKSPDPNPPKYEYGYDIVGDKGGHQGKQEQRDGIYASGRYFVQNKDAKTDVQYFADDWGYHPAVEYSSAGPHSKASAKFALGHEAVVQLRNKENNLPQLQGLPDTGPLNKDGGPTQSNRPAVEQPNPSQQTYVQQSTIKEDPQPPYDPFNQQVLVQQQSQQQVYLQPQPQQVYLQQQPQEQQVLVQEQPQLQEQKQLVIQHIQQPVENIIFPQTTPTPSAYQTQEPQQLLVEQQQHNVALVGQQNIERQARIHQEQTQDQSNDFYYQQFGLKLRERRPNKLIQSTQHLVTGQDVLNINSAATNFAELGIQSTTPCSTITDYEVTTPSFKTQPIIVADINDNKIVSTSENIQLREEEQLVSTTASTLEAVSTTYESTSPTPTIVVTPRPVGTTFLAPITAGVRLESTEKQSENYNLNKQINNNVQVEIQKTIPYYLGKYEYPLGQDQYANNQSLVEENIKQDVELGKTLLYFPGQITQNKLHEVDNHISTQQLPNQAVQNQFVALDQQFAQGYQHQVYFQQLPHQDIKEATKLVHQPYPVQLPVTKQVPAEKFIDRPVHIPIQVTKYINRPYPVEVQVPIPQPYPVERIVHKLVKQPYPVEIRVPFPVDRIVEKKVPVPHYIEKPVTVEKIVEKPVPQYIDRPYPVHIQVPQPVPVPVDRIVEKKIPVPQYIEKQVPVEKIVERPVPQYIDRPYPVQVRVPVPQPYYVKVEVPKPYPVQLPKLLERPYYAVPLYRYHQLNYGGAGYQNNVKSTLQTNFDSQVQSSYNSQVESRHNSQIQSSNDQSQSEGYHYPNPYTYAPQNNFYLPPKKEIELNNGYLPPDNKNCDHVAESSKQDNYLGLLPPKIGKDLNRFLRKYRSARSSFNDNNIKMEYGFMPPLVPSLEIDEFGNPVEKANK